MSGLISFLSAKFFEVVVPAGLTVLSALKDMALAALVAAATSVFTAFVSKYSPVTV